MNGVKVTLGVEERCSHSTDMKGIERELNTEEEWGDEIGSYPPHVRRFLKTRKRNAETMDTTSPAVVHYHNSYARSTRNPVNSIFLH